MAGSQGRSSAVFWAVAAAVVVLSCGGALAVTFEVGGAGAGGWKLPDTTNKLNYTSWAAKNKFRVGDVLHFTYINKAHNVLPLPTLDAFTSCDFSGANMSALLTGGSSSVRLTTTGPAYYVCSVPGHCRRMKFQINVTDALAPAPAPVVTPPPAATPTTAPETSPTTSPSPPSPPSPFEASSPGPSTEGTDPSSAPLSVVVSRSLAAIVVASTMLLFSLF